MEILNRMQQITEEYSSLPQMDKIDLTLDAVGDDATIKVTLLGAKNSNRQMAERTISPQEPLDFITDTFNYPNTITPRSKLFSTTGLKEIHFDPYGYLVVTRDDCTEVFKVNPAQKEEVTNNLNTHFSRFFNKPVETKKAKKRQPQPQQGELLYQVFYTIDGKQDYFIVAGDTQEQVRDTAYKTIEQLSLNFNENNLFSKKISSL